jgi:hypothetical protein
MRQLDYTVQNEGSIFVITPRNADAAEMLADTFEFISWGEGMVVEDNYIESVLSVLQNFGFTVGREVYNPEAI